MSFDEQQTSALQPPTLQTYPDVQYTSANRPCGDLETSGLDRTLGSLDISMGECRQEMSASKFERDHFASPTLPDEFRNRTFLKLDDVSPTSASNGAGGPRNSLGSLGGGGGDDEELLGNSSASTNCFSPNPHYRDKNVMFSGGQPGGTPGGFAADDTSPLGQISIGPPPPAGTTSSTTNGPEFSSISTNPTTPQMMSYSGPPSMNTVGSTSTTQPAGVIDGPLYVGGMTPPS